MKLETRRLRLRLVQLSDLGDVHRLHSIKEVDQYNTLGIPTNQLVTEVILEEWIRSIHLRQEYIYVIELKEDSSFIGLIALCLGNAKYKIATVWYKLDPTFWGQGYATEALKLVLFFGFEDIDLHRIEAGCAVDNVGSIRVLEKVGMIKEGHKREVLPLATGWSDNYEYAMLQKDWEQLKN
ncbi:GNAT family N-acetyltransferase [Aquimarina algicola]|uniref:GNAT family N-acetyltransferase n=1 Tax=Aquimarina algicola TaxID=2589995 RepID=A0A504J366_9FLAO|nr:GNAT family protein [Aquimarina algicola]TPN82448.1 GNAT family N-acetyltransferase [Aquimarina algicola]